ncbi:MAG: hypothetical protein PHI96_02840 [Desulfovibrio sp.]|nr:hypothetical protein [Desulfovibrio sp.]
MSFSSWLQRIFTPHSTEAPDLDADPTGFQWNQNARIVLAIIVVILSAFVVYRILS